MVGKDEKDDREPLEPYPDKRQASDWAQSLAKVGVGVVPYAGAFLQR